MADGVYMTMGVVLTCAKSDPDVCSWILGEQGMALTDEDNYNIRIHSPYQAGRTTMLQCIKQMNHYPGVSLFVVTWQHGVAGVAADHCDARCCKDQLALWPGSGFKLTRQKCKELLLV